MFRDPWFHILAVYEPRGRSMADIVAEVAYERKISVRDLRSPSQRHQVIAARWEAFRRIRQERPDLSSTVIAGFFRCEPSTVRRVWRSKEAA